MITKKVVGWLLILGSFGGMMQGEVEAAIGVLALGIVILIVDAIMKKRAK